MVGVPIDSVPETVTSPARMIPLAIVEPGAGRVRLLNVVAGKVYDVIADPVAVKL